MAISAAGSANYSEMEYEDRRVLLYRWMETAIVSLSEGDLESCRGELLVCTEVLSCQEAGEEKEQMYDKMKVNLIYLELALLTKEFKEAEEVHLARLPIDDLGLLTDHFCFLCQTAGWQLLQEGRAQEARVWLRAVVDLGNRVKQETRDYCIKLLVNIAVEDKLPEKMVGDMISMLSSPQDRLLALMHHNPTNSSEILHEVEQCKKLDHQQLLRLIAAVDKLLEPDLKKQLQLLVLSRLNQSTDFTIQEREECLVMLLYSTRDQPLLAFQVFTKYVEEVTTKGRTGENVERVLVLGDMAISTEHMEWAEKKKWLEGLTFLASSGHRRLYDHFAAHYVALLLDGGLITEAAKFTNMWNLFGSVPSKIELAVALRSGNCLGALKCMERMVDQQKVGATLLAVFSDLEATTTLLDLDTVEQLVRGLAEKNFFHNLDMVTFAVKLTLDREELLESLLLSPRLQQWLVEVDQEGFFSKICWHAGLATSDMKRKHRLLLLSGQLLPVADKVGLTARLASIPAGLAALHNLEGTQRKQLNQELRSCLDLIWEMNQGNGRQLRAVLLYRVQLSLLNGEERGLGRIVDQMTGLRDIKGLDALALMVVRSKKLQGVKVGVKALLAAHRLQPDADAKKVVAVLELMCRYPTKWVKGQVVEVVKEVQWVPGESVQQAVRLVWNCWVKVPRAEVVREEWAEALVVLHNQVTEDPVDHIHCKLHEPTESLLTKIKKITEKFYF